MSFIKLTTVLLAGISLTGCGSPGSRADRVAETNPYPSDISEQTAMIPADYNYWARENLDLQAVGGLLEKADDAGEFERLLNSRDGINNLDLNGDRNVDYISVREFGDEDDDQRGFSLFSMFGPDLIQEIATIFFERGGSDRQGARILLAGNEQIYGENNYYETNRLDQGLAIVNWLFNKNRDATYQSPYYYENYPEYYEPYQIVETPVYRTRVEQLYASPVFVRTSAPTTVTNIKIKSPYKDKWMPNVYSNLAKPTKEQTEFRKNNPVPPGWSKNKKEDSRDVTVKREDRPKGNPNRAEKNGKGDDRPAFEDKPGKSEKRAEKRFEDQPKQMKVDKPDFKMTKQDNKGNGGGNMMKGGNPNKGEGNPNKGGGNGGGKGGGKKN